MPQPARHIAASPYADRIEVREGPALERSRAHRAGAQLSALQRVLMSSHCRALPGASSRRPSPRAVRSHASPCSVRGEYVHIIGGGNGTLLLAHSELRGPWSSSPARSARAASAINDAGLGDRADTHVGSFFDPLPPGAGTTSFRASCTTGTTSPPSPFSPVRRRGGDWHRPRHRPPRRPRQRRPDTEDALRMLCYVRGRERSLAELAELAGSAGLEVNGVRPARVVLARRAVPGGSSPALRLDDQFQGVAVAAERRRGRPRSVCDNKPGHPRHRTVREDR